MGDTKVIGERVYRASGGYCPRCYGQLLQSYTAYDTQVDWETEPTCLQCGYMSVTVSPEIQKEVELRETNRLSRRGPRRIGG